MFQGNRFCSSQVVTCGELDGQTDMMKLTISFFVIFRCERTINVFLVISFMYVLTYELNNVFRSVNRYLLGSGHRLELDIIVENKGEDSFETTFTMGVPVGIHYINIERMDNAEREFLVQCSAPSRTNNNTLRCDLGNPLPQNRLVHFKVLLKPSLTEVMKPRYEFKMNVNSTNPEQEFTTDDNTFKLTVPIWVDAELELRG